MLEDANKTAIGVWLQKLIYVLPRCCALCSAFFLGGQDGKAKDASSKGTRASDYEEPGRVFETLLLESIMPHTYTDDEIPQKLKNHARSHRVAGPHLLIIVPPLEGSTCNP